MKYLIIILLFSSCYDGEINGRKYKIKENCTKSHTEIYFIPIINGTTITQTIQPRVVCDEYRIDTIWKNQ